MTSRMLALVGLALAPGAMPARAEDALAPTSLSVGFGGHAAIYEDTPFGRQLRDAGYGFNGFEPSFTVTVLHALTGWLKVGGELHLRASSEARDANSAGVTGSRWAASETGLTQVTARALVQFAMVIPDDGGETGLEMGVQLGIGAGPTWWWLRDATETAAHLDLSAAMIWNVRATRHFGFGLRILHSGLFQEGLGPRDLGFGPTWSPTAELRLEYAW